MSDHNKKIEAALDMVRDLRKGRGKQGSREFAMTVPARPEDDADTVITEALVAAQRRIAELEAERDELERTLKIEEARVRVFSADGRAFKAERDEANARIERGGVEFDVTAEECHEVLKDAPAQIVPRMEWLMDYLANHATAVVPVKPQTPQLSDVLDELSVYLDEELIELCDRQMMQEAIASARLDNDPEHGTQCGVTCGDCKHVYNDKLASCPKCHSKRRAQ